MFLLLDAGKEPQILLKTNQRAKKAMQQKQEQPAVSYWVTGQENMLQNSRARALQAFIGCSHHRPLSFTCARVAVHSCMALQQPASLQLPVRSRTETLQQPCGTFCPRVHQPPLHFGTFGFHYSSLRCADMQKSTSKPFHALCTSATPAFRPHLHWS